jgi:hypothetical protein
MKRSRAFSGSKGLRLTVFCAAILAPNVVNAQFSNQNWEQLLQAAHRERRVVIASSVGAKFREALVPAFQKAFPGHIRSSMRHFSPPSDLTANHEERKAYG